MDLRNLVTALVAASLLALAVPATAAAELRTLRVTLASGEQIILAADVPPETPLDQVPLAGITEPVTLIEDLGPSPMPTAVPPTPTATPTATPTTTPETKRDPPPRNQASGKSRPEEAPTATATPAPPDPTATPSPTAPAPTPNPAFAPALPDPTSTIRVPDASIDRFRIPLFLLPIYQAAGVEYGVRWEVLAAINDIETDYGRNLNVSSAGAVGWMQFMPATWRMYGTDGNGDGKRDPYNPVDAIFSAARYLRAANAERDLEAAVFAYNHADWYVKAVLDRARSIGALPADLVGSLSGLTQGRFPVHATRADYAGRSTGKGRRARPTAARRGRTSLRITARRGAPVIAVQDGRIVKVGRSKRLGRFVQLQDHYGNTYTYAKLDEIVDSYPAPKPREVSPRQIARELELPARDAKPRAPASAARRAAPRRARAAATRPAKRRLSARRTTSAPTKERLYANPRRHARADVAGRRLPAQPGARFVAELGPVFGLDRRDIVARRLEEGARVAAGTVLGRIGAISRQRGALHFEVRPAGAGAPRIDPTPIVDGWRLLESTAIHRTEDSALGSKATIGQVLLMSKEALIRRVLVNPRVEVYECGRRDIRAGQVDRRVLATLEFLAASGLRPTVTSLRCGHGYYTASGNVSHHSSGNAVDIAAVNGVPILGNQGKSSIAELVVQRLLTLQGTMRPDQIISLMSFEGAGNTFAMSDHADHIHVGYRPQFGANRKVTRQLEAILEPEQWTKLIERLGRLENPDVRLRPSRHALEATKRGERRGAAAE